MATNKPDKTHKFNVKTYPYTQCREQHIWMPYNAAIQKKLAYQIQKCANCPMRRHRVISLRAHDYGTILSRSYRPPKDYRITGGVTANERGQIRVHNFMSEMQDPT